MPKSKRLKINYSFKNTFGVDEKIYIKKIFLSRSRKLTKLLNL